MSISASGDVYGYTSSTAYGPYDHARTPNIISQYDDDLFSIHAISDGTISNTQFKIAIANVTPGQPEYDDPYGTFDIILRKFDDTDARLSILQQ